MSNNPPYITYDKGADLWRVRIPVKVAKENGIPNRRVGSRKKLEDAIELRDAKFREYGIEGMLIDTPDTEPEFVEDGDEGVASSSGEQITSLEELLSVCEVDEKIWEVEKHIVNCWDKKFQVKAWLKRRFRDIDFDYLKELLADMPKARPHKITRNQKVGDHLLEVNIADVHFGRLCWSGETGENFDMGIARERFLTAIRRLTASASGFGIEKILFVLGNDFFQADNLLNQTTSGTQQDTEGRYGKMYAEGVALLIEGIELLRHHARVEVIAIAGNHEIQSNLCAAHCIGVYYRDAEDVTVDWQPTLRKYRQYHDNLIALAHGHGVKKGDWFEVVASEAAALWGITKFRYLHMGHYHHSKVEEHKGLTISHLGSITGTDNWHHESGYVQTRKSASAFVYSKHEGIAAELVCNIPVDIEVNATKL